MTEGHLYNARTDAGAVAGCRALLREAERRGFPLERLLEGARNKPAPHAVAEMRLAIISAARARRTSFVALETASGGAVGRCRWREWFHNGCASGRLAAAPLARGLLAAVGEGVWELAAGDVPVALPAVNDATARAWLADETARFADDPRAISADADGVAPRPTTWVPAYYEGHP